MTTKTIGLLVAGIVAVIVAAGVVLYQTSHTTGEASRVATAQAIFSAPALPGLPADVPPIAFGTPQGDDSWLNVTDADFNGYLQTAAAAGWQCTANLNVDAYECTKGAERFSMNWTFGGAGVLRLVPQS